MAGRHKAMPGFIGEALYLGLRHLTYAKVHLAEVNELIYFK
jgi:hypothetical protein